MAKEIGIAIGGGAAGAILYLATFIGGPAGIFLAYLALLPLFAAGLGLGAVSGLVAAVTATVLVTAATEMTFGTVFALLYALPAAGLIRQALRRRPTGDWDGANDEAWYPPGHLLAWLVIYGCGIFAALALAGGEDRIAAMVSEIESVMGQLLPTGGDPRVAELMQTIAGYFPAILLFSWSIMVIANAAIAEALLAKAGRAIRPKPRYAAVELPSWYAGWTAAVAALALIAPWFELGAPVFVARNAALAMLVPFLLVGLAVIHVWSRRWPARMAILAGCYVVLLVFGWPALLVTGLGFMEQWLLLRRRVAGGTGQEEKR